jgi:hypothetical protein
MARDLVHLWLCCCYLPPWLAWSQISCSPLSSRVPLPPQSNYKADLKWETCGLLDNDSAHFLEKYTEDRGAVGGPLGLLQLLHARAAPSRSTVLPPSSKSLKGDITWKLPCKPRTHGATSLSKACGCERRKSSHTATLHPQGMSTCPWPYPGHMLDSSRNIPISEYCLCSKSPRFCSGDEQQASILARQRADRQARLRATHAAHFIPDETRQLVAATGQEVRSQLAAVARTCFNELWSCTGR